MASTSFASSISSTLSLHHNVDHPFRPHWPSSLRSAKRPIMTIINVTTVRAQEEWNQSHHRLTNYPSFIAHNLFDTNPPKDTFSWNRIITSHLSDGDFHGALLVYQHMLLLGARPDKHTLPRVLKASSCLQDAFFIGRQLHGHVVKYKLFEDKYVLTALMLFYGRLAGVEVARKLFDRSSQRNNSVTWTQLAKLYLEEGKPDLALGLFKEMIASSIDVDSIAMITAFKACSQLKSVHEGIKLYKIARERNLEADLPMGNSILKMYVECGHLEDAKAFIDKMPIKDVVSWTTMIHGFVKNGGINDGLKLFQAMCLQGTKPDSIVVTSLLPACARMSAGKNGKEIHGYILRHGVESTLSVNNALMDMYVKSGFIDSASIIFERLTEKDCISWTVMIMGHSLHGQGEVAIELFLKMEEKFDLQLDMATYEAILHACNTSCRVEEGRIYFNRVGNREIKHLAMMTSILSRGGMFEEARAFIVDHNVEMRVEVQRALLDGCRIHKNIKLGKRIAEQLIEMEPLNAENYVLLSNLQAANEKWDAVKGLRETISDMGLKTKKAYSWIEVRNKVHVFGVGDVSHPRSERIYWELRHLMHKTKEEANELDSDFSLHDVDEERECIVYGHSELLAIAFGLISIHESVAIRVTKNLRVCRICHSFAKMMSKELRREIILKDPERFHHFMNGSCSCNDFW